MSAVSRSRAGVEQQSSRSRAGVERSAIIRRRHVNSAHCSTSDCMVLWQQSRATADADEGPVGLAIGKGQEGVMGEMGREHTTEQRSSQRVSSF